MVNNFYPGKFIVLEGLDGSGKTTQAKFLANYLMEQNQKVLLTCEPTPDSAAGLLIRQILHKKNKVHPLTLQLLMSADRVEHIENEIRPALHKGIWVVSDRYYYSTFVYSSLSQSLEWIKAIKGLNYLFIAPNITFVIDAEPETCLKRIDQQRLGRRSIFEKKEILMKIRQAYKDLSQELPNVKLINGERDIEAIAAEIRDCLEI